MLVTFFSSTNLRFHASSPPISESELPLHPLFFTPTISINYGVLLHLSAYSWCLEILFY